MPLVALVSLLTHAFCLAQAAIPSDPLVSEANTEKTVELETFRVTGTSIKRLDQEKVLPVTLFSTEMIEARDAVTPVAMLTALPQVANATNESANSGTGNRGDNANINLRGIGAGNTLILLNGRRLVAHATTGDVVNVNQLPTRGIDHVDVLRDGASSIYGSDAIAGVINYIMNKNQRGVETRLRYGVPEHGGGQEIGGAFTYGMGFAGGRGLWVTTLETFYRDAIFYRDREFSATANHTLVAPAPFNVAGSAFDSRAAQGIYPSFNIGSGATLNYLRPVNGALTLTTAAPSRANNPEFYYDVNQTTMGLPRTHRINWFNQFEYKLNDRVTAFGEILLYKSKSKLIRQDISLKTPTADADVILASGNPYNPYGSRFYDPVGTPNADGTPRLVGTPQTIRLRDQILPDGGPERVNIDSTVYRALAGLRGKWGATWEWESAAFYSESKTTDESENQVRESYLQQAALRTDKSAFNPFRYTFKVEGGRVVPDLPYSNPSIITDTYIQPFRRDGRSTLGSADFRASGEILQLRGAPVSVAFGGEFRSEYFSDVRPSFTGINPVDSGLNPDNNDFIQASAKTPYDASRTVYSAYGELVVPLVSPTDNWPLLHSLEMNGSARYEHFSDFGDATKPKVGVNWKPVPWVMVRASYNEGFRAPTLSTLYRPADRSTASPPGTVDNYRNPVTNEGARQTNSETPGNLDLRPESSTGLSAGIVLQVPHVKGLSFSVDYWKIEQSDIIAADSQPEIRNSDIALLQLYTQQQLAAGTPINSIDIGSGTANYKGDPRLQRFALTPGDAALFATYNAGRPAAQQLAAAGLVRNLVTSVRNRSSGFISGVDAGITYNTREFRAGRFSLSTDWTYLMDYYTQLDPISNLIYRNGRDGVSRVKSNALITWRKGPWAASVSGYYSSGFQSTATTTAAIYTSLGEPAYIKKVFDNGVFAYRYWVEESISYNANVSYSFKAGTRSWLANTQVRLGVVNLTDEEPPLSPDTAGFNTTAHNHLFAGRTWTIDLNKKF